MEKRVSGRRFATGGGAKAWQGVQWGAVDQTKAEANSKVQVQLLRPPCVLVPTSLFNAADYALHAYCPLPPLCPYLHLQQPCDRFQCSHLLRCSDLLPPPSPSCPFPSPPPFTPISSAATFSFTLTSWSPGHLDLHRMPLHTSCLSFPLPPSSPPSAADLLQGQVQQPPQVLQPPPLLLHLHPTHVAPSAPPFPFPPALHLPPSAVDLQQGLVQPPPQVPSPPPPPAQVQGVGAAALTGTPTGQQHWGGIGRCHELQASLRGGRGKKGAGGKGKGGRGGVRAGGEGRRMWRHPVQVAGGVGAAGLTGTPISQRHWGKTGRWQVGRCLPPPPHPPPLLTSPVAEQVSAPSSSFPPPLSPPHP